MTTPSTAAAVDDERPSEEMTALVPRTAASIGFGLSATNWDEGFRIARVLANSQLVPKDYRGKPEDVVVAMQYGAEVGLPPMAALQSVAVINGKPGLYGDGFLGVIMASPRYLKHVEFYVLSSGDRVQSLRTVDLNDDETKAVTSFWRRGIPEPFTEEFSIADAKRAGLWGKEGPWRNYPARQMKWRARGFAGRDAFAAELRGIKMVDELLDEEATAAALPPPTPLRRSEKAAAALPASVDRQPIPSDNTDPVLTNELPPEASTTAGPASRPAPAKPAKGKPGPVPVPPTPTAKPADGTVQTVRSVVITETAYVTPKDDEPFWEVRSRVEKEGEAPVAHVFSTRDKGLYELAATCEGTPQLFTITWQSGKRRDGSACKVLQSLAAE